MFSFIFLKNEDLFLFAKIALSLRPCLKNGIFIKLFNFKKPFYGLNVSKKLPKLTIFQFLLAKTFINFSKLKNFFGKNRMSQMP